MLLFAVTQTNRADNWIEQGMLFGEDGFCSMSGLMVRWSVVRWSDGFCSMSGQVLGLSSVYRYKMIYTRPMFDP